MLAWGLLERPWKKKKEEVRVLNSVFEEKTKKLAHVLNL
jgi:hypothetical protein